MPSPRHQRGVNLIEIMVSMVIGLFLVLGATTLYVRSKNSADVDDSVARLQETARYAMSVLESDIRMANYWGLSKDSTSLTNWQTAATLTVGTDADDCGVGYLMRVAFPVEGINNSFPNTFTGNCAADDAAATSADVLVLRRAATGTAAADGTRVQVCTSRQGGTLFRDAGMVCNAAGQEVHNIVANIFYVDQQSDQSANVPSLRRKSLIAGPDVNSQEIVAGVEDLQIQLGWAANTNTANAVEYLNPGASIANGQVVAVRVWLLLRSETANNSFTNTTNYAYADRTGAATTTLIANRSYTPGDRFQRLLVSRTFFLRNVTGS